MEGGRMSEFSEAFASRIMQSISHLQGEERNNAILKVVADIMSALPDEQVRELRGEIEREFGGSPHPIIAQALTLIDGHLALREINKEGA
jgi:uncharacterized protein YbgA (DUF1722 family)